MTLVKQLKLQRFGRNRISCMVLHTWFSDFFFLTTCNPGKLKESWLPGTGVKLKLPFCPRMFGLGKQENIMEFLLVATFSILIRLRPAEKNLLLLLQFYNGWTALLRIFMICLKVTNNWNLEDVLVNEISMYTLFVKFIVTFLNYSIDITQWQIVELFFNLYIYIRHIVISFFKLVFTKLM